MLKSVLWPSRTSLALALCLLPFGPCLADDPVAVAKHRQAVMDRMGDDSKAIKLYLSGDGDHATAVTAAQDLEAAAAIVPTLFPKGTDSGALPGVSAAKPDIWDNPDDFRQIESALASQSKALTKALGGSDPAAAAAAFRSLGQNACGACHQDYRGRKDGG